MYCYPASNQLPCYLQYLFFQNVNVDMWLFLKMQLATWMVDICWCWMAVIFQLLTSTNCTSLIVDIQRLHFSSRLTRSTLSILSTSKFAALFITPQKKEIFFTNNNFIRVKVLWHKMVLKVFDLKFSFHIFFEKHFRVL